MECEVVPQVEFDYALWRATYPELSHVTSPTAQSYFAVASTLHRNDGGGPVRCNDTQLQLMNMLVAHIAQLFSPTPDGSPSSQLSGPITSASEGSVSVGVKPLEASGSMTWLTQTKYGSLYWYAMTPYRTMRYIPGPRRVFDPFQTQRVWVRGTRNRFY